MPLEDLSDDEKNGQNKKKSNKMLQQSSRRL